MRLVGRMLLFAGAAWMGAAGGSWAQEVAEDAPPAVRLGPVTSTATRHQTQALDVPVTTTTITRESIDDRMMRDAQDLVRHQPGINVDRQTSGTDPFGNLGGFTIRGVGGNRVRIQVDGNRIQERITDGNRGFFDLNTMKAVEITRGPSSVLWGADALGGMVAFQTLDPEDILRGRRMGARLDANYDSLDRSFGQTVMGAFQFTPELEAMLSVGHRTAEQARLDKAHADGGIWGCPRVPQAIRCNELNPLDATIWTVLGKAVYRPNAEHEFKLVYDSYDSDTDIDQMWDYGLQPNGSFNGWYPRNQVQTRRTGSLIHTYTPGLSLLRSIRTQVSYSNQERRISGTRDVTSAAGVTTRTRSGNNYTEDFLQADIQFDGGFSVADTTHRLTYGIQADRTWTDYSSYNFGQNLNTGTGTSTFSRSFANAVTTRADFYVQDEIGLFDSRLTVTPGLRFATYLIDPEPEQGFNPVSGSPVVRQDATRVIPQVGAILRLDEVYSLYARYAEGFKMPTAQQLYTSSPGVSFNLVPNPDLRPESVRSYEAGVRGQYDRAWFSAGGFYSRYKDFIQSFFNIPGTNDYTNRNLSEVEIWGIEAFGEYRFATEWAATGSLSWQYANQRAEAGAPETAYDGAIPLTATLGLKWIREDWGLDVEGLGTFAAPVQRASSSSLYKPGGFAVFDTYVGWRPLAALTLRAGVQNIFDTRYFKSPLPYTFDVAPSTAVRQTNPLELQTAPGRTFKISATVTF